MVANSCEFPAWSWRKLDAVVDGPKRPGRGRTMGSHTEGLGEIAFVMPWLAVGGAMESEADVRSALRLGVTHVVNCRVGFDDAPLLAGRTEYLWNPTPDDRRPKPASWFLDAIRFARRARSRRPDAKILVHCTGGSHRSPSLAYAILRSCGYERVDASRAVMRACPSAELIYGDSAESALHLIATILRRFSISIECSSRL